MFNAGIVPVFLALLYAHPNGVREVKATSCEVIRVNVAVGMTTQIVFEQEPDTTLHADQRHFKITSNPSAKNSIAVIPVITSSDLQGFRLKESEPPSAGELSKLLDRSFRTNLFVFFKNQNQLMFELRFVEKPQADFILRIKQEFSEACQL